MNDSTNISKKKVYMYVNVILTFDTTNHYGDTQEFFNLSLPVSKSELNALTFIHSKLFKRITKKCLHLKRDARDLIKISTGSDWNIFEQYTNLESLCGLGHSCKWYFGNGRTDLDNWEMALMSEYGFGTLVDMSYLNDPQVRLAAMGRSSLESNPRNPKSIEVPLHPSR